MEAWETLTLQARSKFFMLISCGVRVCAPSLLFYPSASDRVTQNTSLEKLGPGDHGDTICREQNGIEGPVWAGQEKKKTPRNPKTPALEVELLLGLLRGCVWEPPE